MMSLLKWLVNFYQNLDSGWQQTIVSVIVPILGSLLLPSIGLLRGWWLQKRRGGISIYLLNIEKGFLLENLKKGELSNEDLFYEYVILIENNSERTIETDDWDTENSLRLNFNGEGRFLAASVANSKNSKNDLVHIKETQGPSGKFIKLKPIPIDRKGYIKFKINHTFSKAEDFKILGRIKREGDFVESIGGNRRRKYIAQSILGSGITQKMKGSQVKKRSRTLGMVGVIVIAFTIVSSLFSKYLQGKFPLILSIFRLISTFVAIYMIFWAYIRYWAVKKFDL